MPDLVNKNIGCPVKLEIQISNDFIFKYKYVPCNTLDIFILKLICIYLKFKFDWESYILSGSPVIYIGLQNTAENISYYSLSQEKFITLIFNFRYYKTLHSHTVPIHQTLWNMVHSLNICWVAFMCLSLY